ncbi:class I SAM-dependent methyltransferase [Actinoplanes sp. NPDC051851]|uniref:class I SAM-dependent methyltransferase n=1 Tax=Actinoplanes sp. NPDC051851 TaxID=3154753 RepID=UPI003445739A
MKVVRFFEEAYRRPGRYWWKGAHAYSTDPDDHAGSLMAQAVLRHARAAPTGRALDMGSGEGADAIRLARLGWDVDAVEPASTGVQKIKEFAAGQNVHVNVFQGNILEWDYPGEAYDLIVCNGVLHYIEDKYTACRRLQSATRVGGLNALSLWSDFTPVPQCHEIVPTFPDTEFGSVYEAYRSWEKTLLYFERNRAEMGHNDMPDHRHSFIKIIARRSG